MTRTQRTVAVVLASSAALVACAADRSSAPPPPAAGSTSPTSATTSPPTTTVASPTPTAPPTPAPPPAPVPAPVAGFTIDPGDGGRYQASLDPADVVDTITNPYLPLTTGSRWVYEGTDDDQKERTEVVVTGSHRLVAGIPAVVVHDTVTVDGERAEDTYDWYAQDRDGNVWYLGEDTTEYQGGKAAGTAGSWETGVDGARPGIVMKAAPSVGDAYRQEYLAGQAEDLAQVVAIGAAEHIASRALDGLLVIREWTPLDTGIVEDKYYAAGIGLVVEQKVAGGTGRAELVEFTAGG